MSEQEPESIPYIEPDNGQDNEGDVKPEQDKHPTDEEAEDDA